MTKLNLSHSLFVTMYSALVAMSAAGCSDLIKQPYPAKEFFGLEPAGEAVRAERLPLPTTSSSDNRFLTIRSIRIAPPYDGLAFIYRDSAAGYASDYYANWVAKPSDLLKAGLEHWLDLSGPLRVIPAGSPAQADWVMELDVARLFVDRTDPTHPKGVLSAHLFLFRTVGSTQNLVADEIYDERAPAAAQTPAAYAEAISEAYKQVLLRLTAQLQHTTDSAVEIPKRPANR